MNNITYLVIPNPEPEFKTPERRTWNIPVGRLPKGQAEEYIRMLIQAYRKKISMSDIPNLSDSEQLQKYNDMVAKINAMSNEELDDLIKKDECPFQPELIPKGTPLGMFHCQVCGEMVVAGVPHPRLSLIEDLPTWRI